MKLKSFLLFLWQLPQNIVGLCTLLVNKRNRIRCGEYYLVKHLSDRAVSLGSYILFDSDRVVTSKALAHEKGHQKQSVYLGWLYLPVIGLPSVTGNVLRRFIKFDYYSQPWEAWADRLGNVKR